jgi:DNA-binding MarR family transcriptional regulator
MARSPVNKATATDPRGEFPLDVLTYVFHLFAVASRHREARLDEILQPLGLNLSRYRSLSVIATFEPCAMSELAEYTAIDRTTLTRVVDHLVDDALVARATPPQDRRQVVLTLTDKGRDAYRGSVKAIYRLNRQLLEGLPEDEMRRVARALAQVTVNLTPDPDLQARLLLRHRVESR